MCGRYTLKTNPSVVQEELGLAEPPVLQPRYNIAPTQAAPIVTSLEAPRQLVGAQWGLIPHWAKDPRVGARNINARSESLAVKPTFRDAFRTRRCLVVADGFYEWAHAGAERQPFFIHLQSGRPFTLAGLWERWRSKAGVDVVSFTIVTTRADPFMSRLHDRMPVFLDAQARDRWLSPTDDLDALQGLLGTATPAPLEAYEVTPHVNSAAADDPKCLAAATRIQLSLL